MVKTSIQFDVERVRKLGEGKYGARFTDQQTWARAVGISFPTLQSFLDGVEVRTRTVDAIVAPFGLTAFDVIVRRNGKK